MKRMFLLLPAVALLSLSTIAQKNDDDKRKIEGSGIVTTKNISVQPFTELDVKGVFSVQLMQGGKEEVKVEADDNLHSLFEIKNEGSTLSITMKKDMPFESKKKIKVFITFKTLKSMELKTIGDVSSGESLSFDNLKLENKSVGEVNLKLTAQSLDVDNKSVGDITLSGKADKAVIKNKSVGSLNAGSFVVQTMDIDNTGVGSAEVNAEKELKVKDSFLGKVTNKGSAQVKKIKTKSI